MAAPLIPPNTPRRDTPRILTLTIRTACSCGLFVSRDLLDHLRTETGPPVDPVTAFIRAPLFFNSSGFVKSLCTKCNRWSI